WACRHGKSFFHWVGGQAWQSITVSTSRENTSPFFSGAAFIRLTKNYGTPPLTNSPMTLITIAKTTPASSSQVLFASTQSLTFGQQGSVGLPLIRLPALL